MNSSQSRKRYFGSLRRSDIYIYLSEYLETRKNNINFLFLCSYFQFEVLQPLQTFSNHPHHLGPVPLSKFISWTSIVLHFVIFTNKLCRLEKCGCFAPRCFFFVFVFLFFFYHWRLCKSGAGQSAGLSGWWHSHSGSRCPGWAGSSGAPPRAGPALQDSTEQMVSTVGELFSSWIGYYEISHFRL